MNTYRSYLNEPCAISFEQMLELHNELISEISGDAEALEIYDELIAVSTRYTGIRASWEQLSREEKMDKDPSRTSCHNSVITHFNMLSRYLRMQGKEAAWRDTLGYEEDNPYNRKKIGDFTCYLVFINNINAR